MWWLKGGVRGQKSSHEIQTLFCSVCSLLGEPAAALNCSGQETNMILGQTRVYVVTDTDF